MELKSKKFILGAGIAGLIAKYYNPTYQIITPEVGGQLTKSKNILITFYIHNHPEIRKLLEELKIPYKEKRLRIYYRYNNKTLESLDKKTRLKFIKFKMAEYDYDNNSVDVDDLNLSTESNYLDILDVDVELLLNRLRPKALFNGKVKLINNNRKFLIYQDKEGNLIKANYDKLISTIPSNDFFNILYNYKSEYFLNYLPATYVLSSSKPDFMEDDAMYYVCNNNLIYNRVQPYNGNYVYEITGIPSDEEIKKQIKNIISIEKRYVGVIKSEKIDDFKHIKFIGRMAEWNHSVHVEENILKAKEIRENDK